MEIKCNQTKKQNQKPRNAENSPKNKEKMLSLVKIHDSKKRCYSNQSAKNSKMYVIIFAIR